jgi:NAD(P)H dehydrogenase (quinone)
MLKQGTFGLIKRQEEALLKRHACESILHEKEPLMSTSSAAPRTVVVYHSGYGHTKRLAEAVAEGASASLFAIDADGNLPEEAWTALDSADSIIFGSPTYMGGPSWQFKRFADASSKAWFELKWKDKLFGGFTNSASLNGDKLNTLQYFVLLAGQHGGLWVSLAMKPANVKASKRDDPNRMGAYLAPMAQCDADAAPSEMSEGDLETARLYGLRIAETSRRFATS